MHAKLGDTLHIRAHHTDVPDQWGRIIEIRGPEGTPPYLVEFPNGHTSLVFPGPDAIIEPGRAEGGSAGRGEALESAAAAHGRRVHARPGW